MERDQQPESAGCWIYRVRRVYGRRALFGRRPASPRPRARSPRSPGPSCGGREARGPLARRCRGARPPACEGVTLSVSAFGPAPSPPRACASKSAVYVTAPLLHVNLPSPRARTRRRAESFLTPMSRRAGRRAGWTLSGGSTGGSSSSSPCGSRRARGGGALVWPALPRGSLFSGSHSASRILFRVLRILFPPSQSDLIPCQSLP